MQPKLSLIVPFQANSLKSHPMQRLKDLATVLSPQFQVEVVVGESRTSARVNAEVRRVCAENGFKHVSFERPAGAPFSAARARNAALQAAEGEFVLFWDLDLACGEGFWPLIFKHMQDLKAPQFLMLPCLYLTAQGTSLWNANRLNILRDNFLSGRADDSAHLAVCSSAVLVSRDHVRALGGFRDDFLGHGYEDFEFLHRLAAAWPWGDRPADYSEDNASRVPAHLSGFRAYLARYSFGHFFSDLLLVHRYHSISHVSRYYRARAKNFSTFSEYLQSTSGWAPSQQASSSSFYPQLKFAEFVERVARENGVAEPRKTGLFQREPVRRSLLQRVFRKSRKLLLRPRQFMIDSRILSRGS